MSHRPESAFNIVVQPFEGKRCGNIHAVLDGVAFPEEGWRDFVIDILGSWCCQSCEIKQDTVLTHYFFDGPWSIEARLQDSEVTLTCNIGRSRWPGIPPSCTVPLVEYRKAILRACTDARDSTLKLGLPLDETLLEQMGRLEHLMASEHQG